MALLLDKRRRDLIIVTEEAIPAIATWCNKEVMELLLEGRGHEFIITEEIMKAAAGNKFRGKEVIELLLNERRDEIIITEEVVEAAARCGSDENLDVLYQQKNNISDWDKWYCISKTYESPEQSPITLYKLFKDFEKDYIER